MSIMSGFPVVNFKIQLLKMFYVDNPRIGFTKHDEFITTKNCNFVPHHHYHQLTW